MNKILEKMQSNDLIDCVSKLKELKSICELPRLYLSDYFIDLRAEVDLCFAQKTENSEKWQEIIDKINSFEQDLIQRSYKLNFNANQVILNELEDKIASNNENVADQLELEEFKLLKILFNNNSIFFVDCIENSLCSSRLVIISEFICKKGIDCIKNKYLNRILLNFNSSLILIQFRDTESINKSRFKLRLDCFLHKIKNELSYDRKNILEIHLNIDQYKFIDLQTQFAKIDKYSFINFKNLIQLAIRNNTYLKQIPADTFSEQNSLEKISIAHNENLQYIHLNSFKNLIYLMELNLSYNGIESIDEYLFNDLKSLKRLCLNNNKVINFF